MTETTRYQFLVEPNNPDTFEFEELDELARQLQESDPTYDARVAFSGDQVGAGPEWQEIINVWIPLEEFINAYVQSGKLEEDARNIVVSVVSGVAIQWLMSRPDKQATPSAQSPPIPEEDLRPKRICHLYGPDGKILKTVMVKYPYEEVEYPDIQTPESHSRKQPPTVDEWPPKPPYSRKG